MNFIHGQSNCNIEIEFSAGYKTRSAGNRLTLLLQQVQSLFFMNLVFLIFQVFLKT